MPISVPLARRDQDPGPAVLIAVILVSCARASAAPTPTSCGTGWPSRNRRARLVWRINPKKAARLQSQIADEVVAPADMGSGQGREAQPDPFGHLSKIISRL